MQDLLIGIKTLQALASLTAQKDHQNWATGINIETGPWGVIAYAFNGGPMLTVARLDATPQSPGRLFCPRSLVQRLKPARGSRTVALCNDFSADAKTGDMEGVVTLHWRGSTVEEMVSVISWPENLLHVVPRRANGKPATYDFALLALLDKAAKTAGWGKPILASNGFAGRVPGMVRFMGTADVFAVVMPLDAEPVCEPPDWAVRRAEV